MGIMLWARRITGLRRMKYIVLRSAQSNHGAKRIENIFKHKLAVETLTKISQSIQTGTPLGGHKFKKEIERSLGKNQDTPSKEGQKEK